MPMTIAEIVAARRRKTAPTAFEKRIGYVPKKPAGGGKMSTGMTARPMDGLANTRANRNRSYSYMTAAETWKIRWGK